MLHSSSGCGVKCRGDAFLLRGALVGIRTRDLILTKNVLCLLSYKGLAHVDAHFERRAW